MYFATRSHSTILLKIQQIRITADRKTLAIDKFAIGEFVTPASLRLCRTHPSHLATNYRPNPVQFGPAFQTEPKDVFFPTQIRPNISPLSVRYRKWQNPDRFWAKFGRITDEWWVFYGHFYFFSYSKKFQDFLHLGLARFSKLWYTCSIADRTIEGGDCPKTNEMMN